MIAMAYMEEIASVVEMTAESVHVTDVQTFEGYVNESPASSRRLQENCDDGCVVVSAYIETTDREEALKILALAIDGCDDGSLVCVEAPDLDVILIEASPPPPSPPPPSLLPPSPPPPASGDDANLELLALLVLVPIGGLLVLYCSRRSRRKKFDTSTTRFRVDYLPDDGKKLDTSTTRFRVDPLPNDVELVANVSASAAQMAQDPVRSEDVIVTNKNHAMPAGDVATARRFRVQPLPADEM